MLKGVASPSPVSRSLPMGGFSQECIDQPLVELEEERGSMPANESRKRRAWLGVFVCASRPLSVSMFHVTTSACAAQSACA
ncbi:hypothetical protein [Xanthomonas fragariae]|uniref:hypothetical protein n=1 Tax=Xanthomonas fragariae TaxID=48664 RepID=UPI00131EFBDF|nr:hypothetical protein [Xanthomonas fragariae]